MMIYRVIDHYGIGCGEGGERLHIQEFMVEHGVAPSDFPRFKAVGAVTIQHLDRKFPRHFFVNLEAEDLLSAFEQAPSAIKKMEPVIVKEFEEELRCVHKINQ